MSKSNKISCKPGQILKEGYRRKEYVRGKYVKKDGTIVKKAIIPQTIVPPTCVPDKGRPGKGPKILPQPKGDIHLTDYGYSVYKSDKERRAALRNASKYLPMLMVKQHLGLLRNLQATRSEPKKIMTRDVEYMKALYADYKKRNQKGGNPDRSEEELDNDKLLIMSEEKSYDSKEGYKVITNVYEEHTINGDNVLFKTLNKDDAEDVLRIDKEYFNEDEVIDNVIKRIESNPGQMIGLYVNKSIVGYCHFNLNLLERYVILNRFWADPGYGTSFYKFLERYFNKLGYTKIYIYIDLSGSYISLKINFWIKQNFHIKEYSKKNSVIIMEKNN